MEVPPAKQITIPSFRSSAIEDPSHQYLEFLNKKICETLSSFPSEGETRFVVLNEKTSYFYISDDSQRKHEVMGCKNVIFSAVDYSSEEREKFYGFYMIDDFYPTSSIFLYVLRKDSGYTFDTECALRYPRLDKTMFGCAVVRVVHISCHSKLKKIPINLSFFLDFLGWKSVKKEIEKSLCSYISPIYRETLNVIKVSYGTRPCIRIPFPRRNSIVIKGKILQHYHSIEMDMWEMNMWEMKYDCDKTVHHSRNFKKLLEFLSKKINEIFSEMLLQEAKLLLETIAILAENRIGEIEENLPILLIRAVVIEHSLLLFRRTTQRMHLK